MREVWRCGIDFGARRDFEGRARDLVWDRLARIFPAVPNAGDQYCVAKHPIAYDVAALAVAQDQLPISVSDRLSEFWKVLEVLEATQEARDSACCLAAALSCDEGF